jgi:hypothetical protein
MDLPTPGWRNRQIKSRGGIDLCSPSDKLIDFTVSKWKPGLLILMV